MTGISLIASAALPAVLAAGAIALLRKTALVRHLADHPNARSLHATPTPRIGGLAVMAAAMPFAFAHADSSISVILAGALVLAALSSVDDLFDLPYQVRLPAHALVSLLVLLIAASPSPTLAPLGPLGFVVAFVGLVWMANLYNFMDGADGLAGGMGLIGFGALAAAAALSGSWPVAAISAAFASACAGFLLFNFPPARVFLGDAGSIPLGFLAGALGGYGTLLGLWTWSFPVLVFSPFIVDATITLLRRLLSGERIWQAHRGHFYQRLVLSGWSARRLALTTYALMIAAATFAFISERTGEMLRCGILAAWLLLLAVMVLRGNQLPSSAGKKKS